MRLPIRSHALHLLAERAGEGRGEGPQEKRALQAHRAKLLARDAGREVLDIDRYVRQLGHDGAELLARRKSDAAIQW